MPKKPKPVIVEQVVEPGCADLLEAVLFVPQGATEYDFLLGADVRFGTMVVASDDWSKSVEIGLSKAILHLDLRGCEIDPSAYRFGDQKPTSAKTHVQRTQVASRASHVGGKASLQATTRRAPVEGAEGTLALGAGLARDTKVSSTEIQIADRHEQPVVAMAGNRWRFSSVAEAYMQSRYSGDDTLCKLRVKRSAIRVRGQLSFQPKDIVLVDVESPPAFLDLFKKSPNKAAIAKVLLSKHLREINPLQATKTGAGSIIGCVSTLRIKSND